MYNSLSNDVFVPSFVKNNRLKNYDEQIATQLHDLISLFLQYKESKLKLRTEDNNIGRTVYDIYHNVMFKRR
jgi:hypothetical protein